MNIERGEILYFIEFSDSSLMRSVTYNLFIYEIFALFFDGL